MAISGIGNATSTQAQSAYGLDFQSLLQIILTQLTYQDPLKPMDNYQFVSQLAEFSQLQQTQSLNDQITTLLKSQASTQATSLLGRTVDIQPTAGTAAISGTVKAVVFSTNGPQLTVETSTGQTFGSLSLADVTQVR